MQGEALLLKLVGSTRRLSQSLQGSCDGITRKRKACDSALEQMHALDYEKRHLQREIAINRGFTSKSDERLLLAGANVTSAAVGPEEHQTVLQQLALELGKREQLSVEANQLGERRRGVQADVMKKRARLEALSLQVDKLCDASKPLREEFGAAPQELSVEQYLGLPSPLFFLMSQFEAHKNAFEPDLTAEVHSEAEKAARPERAQGLNAEAAACLRSHETAVKVGLPVAGQLILQFQPKLAMVTAGGSLQPAKTLKNVDAGDTGDLLPNPGKCKMMQLEVVAISSCLANFLCAPFRKRACAGTRGVGGRRC